MPNAKAFGVTDTGELEKFISYRLGNKIIEAYLLTHTKNNKNKNIPDAKIDRSVTRVEVENLAEYLDDMMKELIGEQDKILAFIKRYEAAKKKLEEFSYAGAARFAVKGKGGDVSLSLHGIAHAEGTVSIEDFMDPANTAGTDIKNWKLLQVWEAKVLEERKNANVYSNNSTGPFEFELRPNKKHVVFGREVSTNNYVSGMILVTEFICLKPEELISIYRYLDHQNKTTFTPGVPIACQSADLKKAQDAGY